MDKTRARYLATSPEGRGHFLIELISKHGYFLSLNQLLAEEDIALISKVAKPLQQAYPHFFDDLLCRIAQAKGMEAVVGVLKHCHFAQDLVPIELSRIDRYVSSNDNPLAQFYQEYGPVAFFTLYEANIVDLRQLYLWLRSQPKKERPYQYEDFIVALAIHYAGDFIRAPKLLSECFITELDIAVANDSIYLLKDHVDLIIRIQDCLSHQEFDEFLIYLGAKLRGRPLREVIENLVFIEFLRYAHAMHITIATDQAHDLAYWRWLLGSSNQLGNLHRLLPPLGNF